jgi:hypothetical protein
MSINNDLNFDILNTAGNGGAPLIPVSVYWNGVDLAAHAGPTPFVDIGTSFARTADDGVAETITRTITLTGKIVRAPDPKEAETGRCPSRTLSPGEKGIQGLIGAQKQLEKLFTDCSKGTLEIKCRGGNTELLAEYKNVVVNSINFDRTDDNWAKTTDYSIELQSVTPPSGSDTTEYVTERSDTWTIEQLEDIVYTKFSNTVIGRHEWQNPNMQPGASTGGPNSSISRPLQVINIPQFRITRRLSAKGLGTKTLGCSGRPPSGTGAVVFAKMWVEKMTSLPFDQAKRTGIYQGYISFFDNPNQANTSNQKTFLYNHNRTINVDISNGTYEANDTWLGMPTGMPYIDSYTVETSTGLDYIKTVTVAGNIQGLVFTPVGFMDGTSGVLPSGSGTRIGLDYSLKLPPTTQLSSYDIDNPGSAGRVSRMANNKYNNAVSGWIYDIKPYLYRRACLAVNQGNDRTTPYVNPATQTPPQAPQNPIYSKETLLSVIPISTTEGHDPKKGTVSYNYQYSNKFNIISGTISENITITNDLPTQVVAEIPVPGRQLGPILNAAGYTSARKTVAIEVVVMPPTGTNDMFVQQRGCPLFTGGFIYTTINKLTEGVKPFGFADTSVFGSSYSKNRQGQVYTTADQDTWSPTQGRYTRTVTWTYQQCTNARSILDH